MENNLQLLNSTDVLKSRTLSMVYEEQKEYFKDSIEELLEDADYYNLDTDATYQNLDLWCENKSHLFNLLKTSPYWNEKELCVELPYQYKRDIDTNTVKNILSILQRRVSNDWFKRNTMLVLYGLIDNYLDAETMCVSTRWDTINENKDMKQYTLERCEPWAWYGNYCEDFVNKFHIRSGMKMSKVINKVITESGCNIDLNLLSIRGDKINGVSKRIADGLYETIWYYTYNQWYAIISDCLNPKYEEKIMYISINPMDYLTQSHGSSNWGSCHSLRNRGCYHSATLTMMTDVSTIIVYALPKEQKSEFWKYDKLIRCSMFIGENFNCLLQNVFYPSRDMNNSKQVREYLEKLMSNYLGVTDLWLVPSLKDVQINTNAYLGYEDWRCGKEYNCAKLKDSEDSYKITIGHTAYAVNNCDKTITENDYLSYNGRRCCRCEEYYNEDYMTYLDLYDEWVCDDCLEENYRWCKDTERYVWYDDCFYAEDTDSYYEEEDSLYYCEYTGNYYRRERSVTYVEDYGYVNKDDLYDSGYFYQCEDCGNWFKKSYEHNYYDGYDYCDRCYRDLEIKEE